jgi:hypothetical protein
VKIRSLMVAAALAAAFTPACASLAHATNFCVSFGGARVVASGLVVPLRGTCTSFNGFYANQANVLLAGDICRSSDNTTVLFNTFTQFNGKPDSLVGKWSAATGTGFGNECNSVCTAFTVTVTKCAKVIPIPQDLSDLQSEQQPDQGDAAPQFLTTEEP